jgi:hypothetical protein
VRASRFLSVARLRCRFHFCIEGESRFAVSVSVGSNDPASVALVRGANGGSRYAMPFRVIPDRGQASEYRSHPSIKQRCHVLQQRDPWSYHAKGSAYLPPETRTLAGKSGTLSSV